MLKEHLGERITTAFSWQLSLVYALGWNLRQEIGGLDVSTLQSVVVAEDFQVF